jgi:methylated-DNA-[protein]-cysteine S-methyltransferase
MSMNTTRYCWYDSPFGRLLIAGDDAGLRSIFFDREGRRCTPGPDWTRDDASHADAVRQLGAYFEGRLTRFDLALAPRGTEFQLRVWRALTEIPYGRTASYAQIAARIGRPAAVRAVGAANGANPLPIVVPCHRVIGADGSLTGYGGGLDLKASLLALERAVDRPGLFQPRP